MSVRFLIEKCPDFRTKQTRTDSRAHKGIRTLSGPVSRLFCPPCVRLIVRFGF